MMTECGIITDLLPLYVDGVCSPESQAAIERHLQECPECQEIHRRMTSGLPEKKEPEISGAEEGRSFKRGLKKVRRRWALSLLATLLTVPLLFMSVAQVRGEGVCFTNLGQIFRSYQFVSLLKSGAYGKAFDLLDSESQWKSITDSSDYLGSGTNPENYQPILIDGEKWMFSPNAWQVYFDELPEELEGAAALEFWETTYQHTQSGNSHFFIPEEALKTLYAQGQLPYDNPESDGKSAPPDSVTDVAGNRYFIGTYNGSSDERYSLYDFPCVPEAFWETMLREQRQDKIAFDKRAAEYLSLGYEQWLAKSREQFILGMKDWEEEHGRITRIRLRAAYYAGEGKGLFGTLRGNWQLEYNLQFAGSKSSSEGIILSVNDKKVVYSGGFWRSDEGPSIMDRFLETLSACCRYVIPDGEE